MKTLLPVFLSLLLALPLYAQEKQASTAAVPAKLVIAKLNSIIIPKIQFNQASAQEAVEFLSKRSVEFDPNPDPAKHVINISFYRGASATDAKIPGIAPRQQERPAAIEPKVSVILTDIPLGDALHYVALLAGLKISIEPSGIVLQPRPGGYDPKNDALAPMANGGDNRALLTKLDQIIFPSIEFHEATLPEVLYSFLKTIYGAKNTDPDPDKKHINIVFPTEPGITDAKISLVRKDASFAELLREIAKQSGMKMTVDPHAVVFTPVGK